MAAIETITAMAQLQVLPSVYPPRLIRLLYSQTRDALPLKTIGPIHPAARIPDEGCVMDVAGSCRNLPPPALIVVMAC
jgi:hypothetical protein